MKVNLVRMLLVQFDPLRQVKGLLQIQAIPLRALWFLFRVRKMVGGLGLLLKAGLYPVIGRPMTMRRL